MRDWDYYTGPTFELFSGDVGFPLGSGGRYDRLLGAFGLEAPATGFVLHVDRCCDALMRGSGDDTPRLPLRLGYSVRGATAAVGYAARLRRAGHPVALDLEPTESAAGAVPAWAHAGGPGGLRWRLPDTDGTGIDTLLAALDEARG